MKISSQLTEDGSSTLFFPKFGETYHSTFGAIQESNYIFIERALKALASKKSEISIFEMGFGTGLNALLTALHADALKINYISIEKFPIDEYLYSQLNYGKLLKAEALYAKISNAKWETAEQIGPGFLLKKMKCSLEGFVPAEGGFDLIYYDAFGPDAQPELWTAGVFERLYSWMNPGGILTTYCAKGTVRRAMIAAGFSVERLPGPPGKRHILRAIRI